MAFFQLLNKYMAPLMQQARLYSTNLPLHSIHMTLILCRREGSRDADSTLARHLLSACSSAIQLHVSAPVSCTSTNLSQSQRSACWVRCAGRHPQLWWLQRGQWPACHDNSRWETERWEEERAEKQEWASRKTAGEERFVGFTPEKIQIYIFFLKGI